MRPNEANRREKDGELANTDLRYRRTERFLLEAFDAALRERPLDKITVTSLSTAADINKATFYLHYRDIYELADAYVQHVAERQVAETDCLDEYFSEPRRFAASIVADFEERREEGMHIARNGLLHRYIDAYATAMHARLSELNPAVDDRRGSMTTSFVLHGILSLLPLCENDFPLVIEVAGDMLEALGEHGKAHFGQGATVASTPTPNTGPKATAKLTR